MCVCVCVCVCGVAEHVVSTHSADSSAHTLSSSTTHSPSVSGLCVCVLCGVCVHVFICIIYICVCVGVVGVCIG